MLRPQDCSFVILGAGEAGMEQMLREMPDSVAFSPLDGVETIARVFAARGSEQYSGEPVTQLEHALQSAALAQQAGASPALVTAALLHDIGHLLVDCGATPTLAGIDDAHEAVGARALAALFGQAVWRPVQLHVAAKRFLVAAEPGYVDRLSPDSQRSLALQGGPFTGDEAVAFLGAPHAADAVRLRRWDEAAKLAGAPTPSLDALLRIAESVIAR